MLNLITIWFILTLFVTWFTIYSWKKRMAKKRSRKIQSSLNSVTTVSSTILLFCLMHSLLYIIMILIVWYKKRDLDTCWLFLKYFVDTYLITSIFVGLTYFAIIKTASGPLLSVHKWDIYIVVSLYVISCAISTLSQPRTL